jgi:hypothetical protein
MASPVKKSGWGAVDRGQLSVTPRSFGSCSFFNCAPEKGNYLQTKTGGRDQGSGLRWVPHPRRCHPERSILFVILSERDLRRTLQSGGSESKDLRLHFVHSQSQMFVCPIHSRCRGPHGQVFVRGVNLQLAEKCKRSRKKCQGTTSPGSPSTRVPQRAIFARWGEGIGLRRWGGFTTCGKMQTE